MTYDFVNALIGHFQVSGGMVGLHVHPSSVEQKKEGRIKLVLLLDPGVDLLIGKGKKAIPDYKAITDKINALIERKPHDPRP